MERFGRLKTEINDLEMLIKSLVISPDVINGKFISLSRVIKNLTKEALLARVEFSKCGEISNYETIINQIRRNEMKGIDPQNDLAPSPPNPNLNRVYQDELNLSTIYPPNNRMQRTVENIQVENQNLYASQSDVNSIVIGGVLRPSVLHQVRDQTLPGPGLALDCNTLRGNNVFF